MVGFTAPNRYEPRAGWRETLDQWARSLPGSANSWQRQIAIYWRWRTQDGLSLSEAWEKLRMEPATAMAALDPQSSDRGRIPPELFSRVLARSRANFIDPNDNVADVVIEPTPPTELGRAPGGGFYQPRSGWRGGLGTPPAGATREVVDISQASRSSDVASPRRTRSLRSSARTRGARSLAQKQKPRWILANVFDLSTSQVQPTPAFRAGASHEIRVLIGAEQEDWLVARGRDAKESIDSMLSTGTHELTVVFFIPALGIHQTDKLTLPPSGPSTQPATFRFKAGKAGSTIEVLISIVHRGRVLQTALLSGKAVATPLQAPKPAITLRLQVVVPGLAGLDQRQAFDAALVTATSGTVAAVAAGVAAASPGKTVLFDQPRIDEAARAIRTVLEEVVTDESTKGTLDSKAAQTLLCKLAENGRLLYERIGERLEKELAGQDLSRLQLVQADPDAFIPIEFTYGLPVPAQGAGLCKNWKRALAGKPCSAEHHKTNLLGHLEVVCPSGFWSTSKVIERQILKDLTSEEMKNSDFGVRAEPTAERPTLPAIGSALFAWSEILDNTEAGTSVGVLRSLNEATQGHAVAAKTWLDWAKAMRSAAPKPSTPPSSARRPLSKSV